MSTDQTQPPTIEGFLRGRGLGDDEIRDLGAEFSRRLRIAHDRHHGFDPGATVRDVSLADAVLDEQTALVCRHCGSAGIEDSEDGSCPDCVMGSAGLPGTMRVQSQRLPVTISGTETITCGTCRRDTTPSGHRVEIPKPPLQVLQLCRSCSLADPAVTAWQLACDVSDQIDALMQRAVDQPQRDLIAQHLAHVAGWFAGWRSDPDGGPHLTAEGLVDEMVAAGKLARLPGGGLIEAAATADRLNDGSPSGPAEH